MEQIDTKQTNDNDNFHKTPVPISKSPSFSPSIRSMTQTVIVSLDETVTHDITYGEFVHVFNICKIIEVTTYIMWVISI